MTVLVVPLIVIATIIIRIIAVTVIMLRIVNKISQDSQCTSNHKGNNSNKKCQNKQK